VGRRLAGLRFAASDLGNYQLQAENHRSSSPGECPRNSDRIAADLAARRALLPVREPEAMRRETARRCRAAQRYRDRWPKTQGAL
jgi:hypothetical protein